MSHLRLAMTLTALLLAHRLLHAAFESASDSIYKGEPSSSKTFRLDASHASDTHAQVPGFGLIQESSLPSAISSSSIQKQLFQYYYHHRKRFDTGPAETFQGSNLRPGHHHHDRPVSTDDDRVLDDDPMTPPDNPTDDDGADHKGNKDDEGAFSIDLLIYCIVMLILIVSTCMKECSRSRETDARRRGQGDEENNGGDDDTDAEGSDGTEGDRRRRRRRRMTPAERREFIMKHLIVQTIPDPDNDKKKKAKKESGNDSDAADSESDTSETRLNVVQSVMNKVIASMQRATASAIAVQSSLKPNTDNDSCINPLTQPLLPHDEATSPAATTLHRESSFTSTSSPDDYYHCCTICMDEYAPGEEICFSKFNRICNHHYHLKCMMSWLLTKRNAERDDACPICRANYLQTSASMASVASSRTSSSRRSRRNRRERERVDRRNSGSNNIPFAMFEDEDSLSLALHSV